MNMQKMLDVLLEEGLHEGCYPGAVAACGCGDAVFAISHVGKISENGPDVNAVTRYDMASLSKIIGPTMLALRAIESCGKIPKEFPEVYMTSQERNLSPCNV